MVQKYEQILTAVIVLQSLARQKLAEHRFYKCLVSATMIQSKRRAVSARQKYIVALRSIAKVQSLWRQRMAQEEWTNARSSAVCIQGIYRCHQSRCFAAELRDERALLRIRSAIFLQRFVRSILLRCHQFEADGEANKAASCLQSNGRIWIARQNIARKIRSIVKIQSMVRRFIAREIASSQKEVAWRLQRQMEQQEVAAMRLQSQYRRYDDKLGLFSVRLLTIQLQATFRMWKVQHLYERCKQAAVRLQSFWRMVHTRHIMQQRFLQARAVLTKRPVMEELQRYFCDQQYALAECAARTEVKLLLESDVPTLNNAGHCLLRLVNSVKQFRFFAESETLEMAASEKVLVRVQKHCEDYDYEMLDTSNPCVMLL